MMEMEDGNKSKKDDFEWTMHRTALLLESCIINDAVPVLTTSTSCRKAKKLFSPITIFASYLVFCKKAFKDGNPPENCPIEVYEKRLWELLPPWIKE